MNCERYIRPATLHDVGAIMPVITAAKQTMRRNGNTHQWADGYPSAAAIECDISSSGGYVISERAEIIGYFAMLPSPEPTYDVIYNGEWLNDSLPYLVIHRIAGLPGRRGILHDIIRFAASHCPNIRIDTHRDNIIMQHCLQKEGFTHCGIILLANGDERLAYQKLFS